MFLNSDFNNITSVKLAPALPMISAIKGPNAMPFAIRAALNGITASALMYKGIPMTAAIGTAHQLSPLAYFAINSGWNKSVN